MHIDFFDDLDISDKNGLSSRVIAAEYALLRLTCSEPDVIRRWAVEEYGESCRIFTTL